MMNDVVLLQFSEKTKDFYVESVLSQMRQRGETKSSRLEALKQFLEESPYFKAVADEGGYDLFVPKKYRAEIGMEWFPIDPSFVSVVKEKEDKLIYKHKLKGLIENQTESRT